METQGTVIDLHEALRKAVAAGDPEVYNKALRAWWATVALDTDLEVLH